MSLNNFIPTVWANRLLMHLQKSLVYGQTDVVNRDYEGQIRQAGDSVKINSIGDVTVKSYTKDTDIDAPETLVDASQMLQITESKYFNFAVDDVDKAQSSVSVMEEAMKRAGYKLKDTSDGFLAALMAAAAPVANLIGDDGTPKTVTAADDAYEYLVDLGTILDENNIPSEGRFVIVPSWYHGLMLKDARFVSAGTVKTDNVLANGEIGQAAGFRIMKSNNVPNTAAAKYKIVAGHDMATSYAEQIVKVEAYRKERGFNDGVKGLHVYGAKVVRPYALAVLTANKS
jgi:N4-gp56 family major capsid protein